MKTYKCGLLLLPWIYPQETNSLPLTQSLQSSSGSERVNCTS